MQVEFTGRQSEITARLREQAQTGLDRIERIVGRKGSAHIFLTEEKFRRTAEVTVTCKACGDLAAKCTDKNMERALHDALEKVEKQALRLVKKTVTKRRHPVKTAEGSVRLQTSDESLKLQPGIVAKKKLNGKAAPKKLPQSEIAEGHLIRVVNGVAESPMKLHQAVKQAAESERDVFVFRDDAGLANVLYRRSDGRVEWIEVS